MDTVTVTTESERQAPKLYATWLPINFSPRGRHGHSALPIPGQPDQILVSYGGNCGAFDDISQGNLKQPVASWKQLQPDGVCAFPARASVASTTMSVEANGVRRSLALFMCGIRDGTQFDEMLCDLAVLDIGANRWLSDPLYFTSKDSQPTPCVGATLTAVEGGRAYLFGGRAANGTPLNDLFELVWQPSELRFSCSRLNPTGPLPSPRSHHVAVLLPNNIIAIHGGLDDRERHSDLFFFDPQHCMSTAVPLDSAHPPARSHHAAALYGSDWLVLWGGFSGSLSAEHLCDSDLWALHLPTMSWSMAQQVGQVPPKRAGHTLTTIGGQVVMVSGREPTRARVWSIRCLRDAYLLFLRSEDDAMTDVFVASGLKQSTAPSESTPAPKRGRPASKRQAESPTPAEVKEPEVNNDTAESVQAPNQADVPPELLPQEPIPVESQDALPQISIPRPPLHFQSVDMLVMPDVQDNSSMASDGHLTAFAPSNQPENVDSPANDVMGVETTVETTVGTTVDKTVEPTAEDNTSHVVQARDVSPGKLDTSHETQEVSKDVLLESNSDPRDSLPPADSARDTPPRDSSEAPPPLEVAPSHDSFEPTATSSPASSPVDITSTSSPSASPPRMAPPATPPPETSKRSLELHLLAVAQTGRRLRSSHGGGSETTPISLNAVNVGDQIEASDCGRWCFATILEKCETRGILVHYEGWETSYDEWLSEEDLPTRTRELTGHATYGPLKMIGRNGNNDSSSASRKRVRR